MVRLKKWSSEGKWLAAGFGILTLLMSLGSFVSYQNANDLIESSKKSQQSYETMKTLGDVFATMAVAESGRRGFIYYGDRKELARYEGAIAAFNPQFLRLRELIDNNLDQLKRLVRLEALIKQRLALLDQSVYLRQKNNASPEKQAEITVLSIELREQIQGVIDEMQTAEKYELDKSIVASQSSIHNRRLIELGVSFSGFTLLFIGFFTVYSQFVRRQKAEKLQHKLEQQKELSELKLRFFSMVSHEFRTPLSVILGSAQLLLQSHQPWTEDRKQKNLQRIQSSAKLMIQLLSDILTLTRAEAGKLESKPSTLDLEAFCLNLIEDFECSSSANHVFELISKCQYTHAFLDEKLLYSTLSNLISNAVKYSPAGGTIQLILSCEPETIIFQVTDQGVGIALENQDRLFEPFYRGESTATIAGTGLGLAVVKKCVDLQRGEILVDSEEGKGTCFTVKIPRHCQL
jgi:signal transduction histidine kinase